MLIEEAIESALGQLGAVAPGVGASVSVDASISDQLYRARLIERRGIVVFLPHLAGLTNLDGTLDGDDSVALAWWIRATRERPLGLVVDSKNRALKVYPSPVPFEELLQPDSDTPRAPPTAPDQAASAEAMELSEAPPGVAPKASAGPPAAGREDETGSSEPPARTPSREEYGPSKLEIRLVTERDEIPHEEDGDDEVPAVEALDAAEGCGELTVHPMVSLVGDGEAERTAHRAAEAECDEPSEPDAEAPPRVSEAPTPASDEVIDAAEINEQTRSAALNLHEARTVKLAPSREVLEQVRRGSAVGTIRPSAAGAQLAAAAQHLTDTGSDPEQEPASETRPREATLPREQPGDVDAPAAPEGAATAETAPATQPPPTSKLEQNERESETAEQPAAPEPAARPVEADEPSDPFHRLAQREWPNWMRELLTTRGPKPLAVVERIFVSAYTPLREAYTLGLAGAEAGPVLKAFADSFEQSYSEAFDALRVRGKRPTMVLDIPEIAQRIARLHGARSTQLVLIDALRFDIGLRVQDRLRKRSRGQASLAERLLLWSALPTTTETQVALIGKGPGGLREPVVPTETPVVVARGRNATTLRRTKAGHKELLKLDVIEAALTEPGKAEPTRLDELADQVAEAMSDYFDKLPPRTLVMMFGDHGFLLDPLDSGSSRGRSGGASPEEVLVPAFAWLVGNVH